MPGSRASDRRALSFAEAHVREWVDAHLPKGEPEVGYDVVAVWYCYILGGWKCLLTTDIPDGMYYEVTYNREKGEAYLDAYKKFDNVKISEEY